MSKQLKFLKKSRLQDLAMPGATMLKLSLQEKKIGIWACERCQAHFQGHHQEKLCLEAHNAVLLHSVPVKSYFQQLDTAQQLQLKGGQSLSHLVCIKQLLIIYKNQLNFFGHLQAYKPLLVKGLKKKRKNRYLVFDSIFVLFKVLFGIQFE